MTQPQIISLLLFVVFLLVWTAGVLLNVGGVFIHLLLIAAVALLVLRVLASRKPSK